MSDDYTLKAFTMSRFCSVFHAEGEYEVDGNLVYIYEPLHYTEVLTKKDRPHWGDAEITFYREGHKDWIRVNRHLMFSHSASPTILMLPPPRATQHRTMEGPMVEVTSGTVLWRYDRWFIRWQGYTHTRAALMVRAGVEWWRNPDLVLPDATTNLDSDVLATQIADLCTELKWVNSIISKYDILPIIKKWLKGR